MSLGDIARSVRRTQTVQKSVVVLQAKPIVVSNQMAVVQGQNQNGQVQGQNGQEQTQNGPELQSNGHSNNGSGVLSAESIQPAQNVSSQEIDVKPKLIKNLIIADEKPSSSSQIYRGTSISRIAQNLGGKANFSLHHSESITWKECKALKSQANRHFCMKFQMFCVQDKCPKKYMEA